MAETLSARLPVPRSGLRPLRLALVTSSYNYIQDGVALTLNRLVRYLENQGVEVLVFAPIAKQPAFDHAGELSPVPSIPLPLRSEYRLALGLPAAARRRLEAFAPDIIHIAVPDLLGHQALKLGLRLGCPVVASYHTRYETYLRYYGLDLLRDPLTRRLAAFYGACREVYVPSASMAEVLIAGGAGGNVHLWPRGVDTVRFSPAKRRASWRVSHGVGAEDIVVAFVGRLVREKRLATLLDMFHRLRGAGVRHRALVVGDGPERAALESALPEAVFTGLLSGEALADTYACADIFVFPSDTETFGSVTLEAMASGLPTVCADATGSRSLVVPGVTGFLADAADGEAFFEAVATLAADTTLRRRMGAAARTRSLRFSWDETMAGLLTRYDALAAAARQPA